MTWDTLHDEDVVYEFRGNSPDQLTNGRYYRGTVDGFADFGVFVTIGESVTGLLHRSQLDRRLESLDWDVGDTVYVQVTNVRDNGNVDLAWSIRQSDAEFRGSRVDDPLADQRAADPSEDAANSSEFAASSDDDAASSEVAADSSDDAADSSEVADSSDDDADRLERGGTASSRTASGETTQGDVGTTGTDTGTSDTGTSDTGTSSTGTSSTDDGTTIADEGATPDSRPTGGSLARTQPLERRPVESLEDRIGELVRIEGELTAVRQTGGPTVFTIQDESGTVDCAAFVEAGVRAYPDADVGDVVRLEGQVERHRDELQVETESLSVLADADRKLVSERLEDAITARSRPEDVQLLAEHEPVEAVLDSIREAATAIRRAVLQHRPIVIRHTATVDGYVAGAGIEHAVLSLVEAEHAEHDAVYHYVERRPLTEAYYDMDSATNDVTSLLADRSRHGAKQPLLLLVGAGSDAESAAALEFLSLYDAGRIVVDVDPVDETASDYVDALVNPQSVGSWTDVTTTALAANVAAHVSTDVRDDLVHLPAISYWTDAPAVYTTLAREAGFDDETVRERRESIALEAYYQRYDEKRELVSDLLFDGQEAGDLASHVSEQFRTKLESAVETAHSNVERRSVDGVAIAILDTDAAVQRFDFPPKSLLLDALHEETAVEGAQHVTVGLALDSLDVRGPSTLDVRDLASTVRERVPDAGISVTGGRLRFLVGKRFDVLEAAVDEIADRIE